MDGFVLISFLVLFVFIFVLWFLFTLLAIKLLRYIKPSFLTHIPMSRIWIVSGIIAILLFVVIYNILWY